MNSLFHLECVLFVIKYLMQICGAKVQKIFKLQSMVNEFYSFFSLTIPNTEQITIFVYRFTTEL